MGAVLGAAQATVLRPHVRRPWRWVGANMAAWAPTMAVIFLGASAPSADWSVPTVVALGTVTGLVAGAVLGLVSGWFLPTLDAPARLSRLQLELNSLPRPQGEPLVSASDPDLGDVTRDRTDS